MKKAQSTLTALSLAAMLCLTSHTPLQAQTFEPGTTVINAGIGIGSSIGYLGSGVRRTPVLSITGEYGVTKLGPGVLGLGLALGYQSASYTYNSSNSYYYKDKWTTTVFGIRGTYHPDFLSGEKYDVYGAIQLSFDHFGYSFTSNDPYYRNYPYLYGNASISSYARAYLIAGGRYYFNKNVGVYAEIGYDIAYLKLGLTIKIDGKNQSAETKK